jgi:homoserine kinase type II
MLTRLHDWLTVPDGSFVRKKDPLEYVRRMRFHRAIRSTAEYGLPGALA